MNKILLAVVSVSIFCFSEDLCACDYIAGSNRFVLYYADTGEEVRNCWACPSGNIYAFSCEGGVNIPQREGSLWVTTPPPQEESNGITKGTK